MQMTSDSFIQVLSQFYTDFGRHDMLWRQAEPDGSFDAYKILVSELMLQQTGVARVTPKYCAFLDSFPTVQELAKAPLGDVLKLWSGLGYNRRAKYLWQAAQMIASEYNGMFPRTSAELLRLPGVGPSSAGAIMAYAFNQPVVYVETNIRTVIIHHFFRGGTGVSDASILGVLEDVLHASASGEGALPPREFYWAMMDYGAFLKQTVGNLNHASTSYAKQSSFHGSRRQLRGQVIRMLTVRPYSTSELVQSLPDARLMSVLADLTAEALIQRGGDVLQLA